MVLEYCFLFVEKEIKKSCHLRVIIIEPKPPKSMNVNISWSIFGLVSCVANT